MTLRVFAGFITEKPTNFKEVPMFEAIDSIDADNGQSNGLAGMQSGTPCNDTIKTHLYVPNLTKVSVSFNFVVCFTSHTIYAFVGLVSSMQVLPIFGGHYKPCATN